MHGGDRKWPLNERQIPNVRGVRVALSTGSSAGVAKQPRELISHPNPQRFDSRLFASLYCACRLDGISNTAWFRAALIVSVVGGPRVAP